MQTCGPMALSGLVSLQLQVKGPECSCLTAAACEGVLSVPVSLQLHVKGPECSCLTAAACEGS